jgi:ribonuclease BN (tRNA processing enzyme)
MRLLRSIAGFVLLFWWQPTMTAGCGSDGVHVQVFGPSDTGIAGTSSSYLIWLNGKARALVNAGAGSAMSFARSGAHAADLDVILFTQLRVADTADLPWLLQFSLPENRSRPLPIYGPDRSKLMPSTVTFVRTLFDTKRGVYRYLGELLSPLGKRTYKLQPHDVKLKRDPTPTVYRNERLLVSTVRLVREPVPALGWRIEAGGKAIVFSGDRLENPADLERLANNSELLIISHNLDEGSAGAVQRLTPAAITKLASDVHVKQLAFTRSLSAATSQGQEMQAVLSSSYGGGTAFPAPMDCLSP